MANVGRISGPLLKSNLVRDDDLAINTNLIYFDVSSDPANPKIGIINGTPAYELDVTGTINATDMRAGSLIVDDLSLDNSTLTTTVGDINIAPATATDFINFNGNVEVAGNIHATGSITADGNLTLGDADTDSITVNADFASHIVPDVTETYDLGSADKRWRDIYLSGQSITLGDIELKDSGNGSLQVFTYPDGELVGELGGLTEAESALIDANLLITGDTLQTTQSNSDLFIKTAGTGKVIIEADENILNKLSDINLPDVFICSEVETNINSKIDETNFSVQIELASGGKCQRCWKIVKEVKDEIELCNRCTGVLKKNK